MKPVLRHVDGIPVLHGTPLAELSFGGGCVHLDLDDEREQRVRLIFEPYQALRVVTADCFELPLGLDVVPKRVTELSPSPWIEELSRVCSRVDHTATFMQKSRHFVVPAQDDFFEVIAWSVVCISLPLQEPNER